MQWNPRVLGTALICTLFASSALAADDPSARKRFPLNRYERKPVNAPRQLVESPPALRKRFPGNIAVTLAPPPPPPLPVIPSQAYVSQYSPPPVALPPEVYYQSYSQPGNDSDGNWESLTKPGSKFEYSLNLGYRVDDFQWRIAGNLAGSSPNILSELTWKAITYSTIEAGMVYQKRPEERNLGHYAELSGFYGEAFDGSNQDSDYAGNNRTGEYSRSNNNADSGYVEGIKFGLGLTYHYDAANSLWRFTGVGGYSYREQELSITNGFQTIPSTGAFGGLNTTYSTMWRGPYMGAEVAAFLGSAKHYFRFRSEYHLANYDGVGNWNLRSDFQHPRSFRHRADGDGTVFMLEYQYAFRPRWTLGFKGQYESWSTDPGIDQTYFSSGATSFTSLNGVDWTSQSYFLTLGYRFN